VLLILLLIGCSGSNIDFNKNSTITSPYFLDKFKSVLNVSKLQAPTSKYNPKYSIHYGKFKGIYNKYFYLENNRYMSFYMCEDDESEYKRSELRFRDDFKVSENHYLKARVKVFPLSEEKEFTFLQIHADANYDNTLNKPLLRIVWRKEYNSVKDHLWAIIRLSVTKANYLKVDLGKRPDKFFDFVIKINKSKLYIFLNGEKKLILM
jgi:hypothetical protein